MGEALFFSKCKCLSEDLFVTPMGIICTALVAVCKVLKKFYYYKNMMITLRTANRICEYEIEKMISKVFPLNSENKNMAPWCSGYHYCTVSPNKA